MADAPKIKIYSTSTCVYCKAEKAFLDEKGIPYESIMVDDDPRLAMELEEVSGGLSVPFTVITRGDQTETILGFDQPRLQAALNLA